MCRLLSRIWDFLNFITLTLEIRLIEIRLYILYSSVTTTSGVSTTTTSLALCEEGGRPVLWNFDNVKTNRKSSIEITSEDMVPVDTEIFEDQFLGSGNNF